MTYLSSAEVRKIVHLAGQHIRLFLGKDHREHDSADAQLAIKEFHQNPALFSDEALLEKGANVDEAHQYSARIELRGVNPEGAAQVVAKGVWGNDRQQVILALRKELVHQNHPVLVRTAGSSSFEFNRLGVDKSLPINYVRTHWESIAQQMGYSKGQSIDVNKSQCLIAADGDGTIYDGPKLTHLPLLKDSPVFGSIVAFLRAGGVFMLVSGNDLNRTFKRFIQGLPPEVFHRVLLSANGGSDLVFVTHDGKPSMIDHYRNNAFESKAMLSKTKFEITYIGDDDSPDGNDVAAFNAVGQGHAVLVKSLQETKLFLEKYLNERKISFT